MAPILPLADAIVTLLNAATLSVSLAAERGYIPQFDLKELNTLKTTVIPRQDATTERFTRAAWQHEVTVDIALQKKWATLEQAEMDGLVTLADEVCEWCKANPPDRPEKLVNATVQVLWDHNHLSDKKLFTTVVRLVFAEAR